MLYVRVSKRSGQTPESQAHVLRGYCQSRGWVVASEHVDRISGDPAKRGQDDPPGLRAALEQLADRRGDVLLVFSADRLTRGGVFDLLFMLRRIVQLGVHVASYRERLLLDTTSGQGEILIACLGFVSKLEREMIVERTIAGQERARAEGKRIGRPPVELPDLERVAQLVNRGHGRPRLGPALGCSDWQARKALAELNKRRARLTEPTKPQ